MCLYNLVCLRVLSWIDNCHKQQGTLHRSWHSKEKHHIMRNGARMVRLRQLLSSLASGPAQACVEPTGSCKLLLPLHGGGSIHSASPWLLQAHEAFGCKRSTRCILPPWQHQSRNICGQPAALEIESILRRHHGCFNLLAWNVDEGKANGQEVVFRRFSYDTQAPHSGSGNDNESCRGWSMHLHISCLDPTKSSCLDTKQLNPVRWRLCPTAMLHVSFPCALNSKQQL